MTYSYHGHWERYTHHYALLGFAKTTIKYWIEQGMSSQKILMGLPMRGATFILKDENEHDFGAPARIGGGERGEYTQHKGYLSFYEIMEKVNSSYTVNHDNPHGTYTYFDKDWISYDDVQDIQRKAQFIREESLGGAMISALDEDEFLGNGKCGKYPLLTAANKVLRSDNELITDLKNCT